MNKMVKIRSHKKAMPSGRIVSVRSHISKRKARTILHEGRARGKKLTEKQREFFGARISEYPTKRF